MKDAGVPVSAQAEQEVVREMRSRYGTCARVPKVEGLQMRGQTNPPGRRSMRLGNVSFPPIPAIGEAAGSTRRGYWGLPATAAPIWLKLTN
jgi:hypothetical protein